MSRKGTAIAIAAALAFATGAGAQSRAQSSGAKSRQSFEEFRKGILNNYQEFRNTLLEHYADFLEGEWHPYESHNGVKRDAKPKPRTVPRAQPKQSPRPAQPAEGAEEPKNSTPKPATQVTPKPVAENRKPEPIRPAERGGEMFPFYGMDLQLPRIDFNIMQKLYSNNDYAAQWRALQKEDVAGQVLPHIKKLAQQIGLNDYLTYQLIRFYIDSKFADADSTSRMAAVHYLLANLGYDVRIATTGAGVPLLLIPFEQMIYSRTFLMCEGKKYYVFEPEGFSLAQGGPQSIMTCRLPADGDMGRDMDLVLGKLNVPMKPKAFDLECGPIHLTGEVNENLMPILYHYPQMPVSGFARSNIQPELRADLVAQMKEQLAGMEPDEAVGKLLTFMHTVFDYATDEEFHGFEKPYFVEEMLYYPKNDCEDRAIFYTYFLWNALGRESQLVMFPGHETATVRLDKPVEGTSYTYDGMTFYMSDPTFIGSVTGQIMPMYENTPPTIDLTYK